MGFSNGYDSGYSDALEDVRNGKVAGLGAGGGPSRAPGFFGVTLTIDMPNDSLVVPAPSTEDLATAGFPGISHLTECRGSVDSSDKLVFEDPPGGWVPGDLLFFKGEDGIIHMIRFSDGTSWDALGTLPLPATV